MTGWRIDKDRRRGLGHRLLATRAHFPAGPEGQEGEGNDFFFAQHPNETKIR